MNKDNLIQALIRRGRNHELPAFVIVINGFELLDCHGKQKTYVSEKNARENLRDLIRHELHYDSVKFPWPNHDNNPNYVKEMDERKKAVNAETRKMLIELEKDSVQYINRKSS